MTVHSTMWGDWPGDVEVHDRRTLGYWGVLRSLLRRCRRGDAVILSGSHGLGLRYADQVVGIVLRRLRPGVALVVADATWTARTVPGEARAAWTFPVIDRLGKSLLLLMKGPRTHVCMLSRSECADVVREARWPASLVHFTPFSTTLEDDEPRMRRLAEEETGSGWFSGGNAVRDYDLLRRAVTGTELQVVVASSRAGAGWPETCSVGLLSHQGFMEAMARSRGVVLPLHPGTQRSAGQQTYLNAMLLRKPVVVVRAPGVEDHVTDGVDALVVDPDPRAIREAMRRVEAGGPEVQRLVDAAEQTALRLSDRRYRQQLLDLARGARGRARARRP